MRVRLLMCLAVFAFVALQIVGIACDPPRNRPPIGQDAGPDGTVVTPDGKVTSPDNSIAVDKGPGPEPEPPKNTSCASVFKCAKAQACGQFPTSACLTSCVTSEKVTGAGKLLFDAMQTCLTTHCTSCNDDTGCLANCVKEKCGGEWQQCASDSAAGTDTCQQVSTCLKGCQNDPECASNCVAKGSQSNVSTAFKTMVCDAKKGAGNQTPDEKLACYGTALRCECPEGNAGTGQKTCADYLTCIDKCGSDSCCVQKCRVELAAGSLAPADKFTLCVSEQCNSCPPNDSACVNKCLLDKCANEFLGCQCPGVGQPGTGNQGCKDGLDCSQKCQANDFCCLATCTASLNSSGYSKYLKFVTCITEECKCAADDTKCIEKCSGFGGDCNSEAISCISD